MNLKERFATIGFFFLFAVFIAAIVLIIAGLKSSPINLTVIYIGIIVLIPFVIYMIYMKFLLDHQTKERGELYEAYIRNLKQTGDKIAVNLDKAIIQERNQYQKNTVVTGKAAALNEISGYGHHNEEIIKHTSCEVTLKLKHHNKNITIEKIVHMGETALRMHFYIQKETILYIDPFDSENYHLDLDFIEA